MPINDIWTGDVHSVYQNNANVFCIQMIVTGVASEENIGNDIVGWLESIVLPEFIKLKNPGVVVRCVTARQLSPNASIEVVTPIASGNVGLRTPGGQAPGQISQVTQLLTNVVDPTSRNRGRDFHYGALVEDLTPTGEAWGVAYLSDVALFYVQLGNNFNGTFQNDFDIGVYSRTQDEENSNPDEIGEDGIKNSDRDTFGDPVFNQLTLIRQNPLVRTQRRRQPEDPCLVYNNIAIP